MKSVLLLTNISKRRKSLTVGNNPFVTSLKVSQMTHRQVVCSRSACCVSLSFVAPHLVRTRFGSEVVKCEPRERNVYSFDARRVHTASVTTGGRSG